MHKDRRIEPRFLPKPGCYIAYLEGSGRVEDLSLNGLFVLDEKPLTVGEEINFSLCSGAERIELNGVVVRSEPGRGMAIQLTNASRGAARHLKRYFSSLDPEPDRRTDQRVLIVIT